jgi:hypothetical protein
MQAPEGASSRDASHLLQSNARDGLVGSQPNSLASSAATSSWTVVR